MEEEHNRELEKLSLAIANAIVKSEEVQKVIGELQEEELICPEGLMVLMIRMRALAEAAEELRDATKGVKDAGSNTVQFIDGRKISSQEAAFHEFCSEKFDENKWLKSIKITLGKEKV